MGADVPLHYTEALVRSAVRAWWWRGTGVGFWAAAAGASAALAALLWMEPTGVWTLALGALSVIAVGVSAAGYLVPLRRSLRTVRAMDAGQATLKLGDDAFGVTSASGSATVLWTAVAEIAAMPDVWLLVYSRAAFSTLPLADLTPEARAFIAERVRRAGGTVSV